MQPKRIKNLRDLTLSLAEQYEKLIAGEISAEEGVARSKMALSMIAASRVRIEHSNMIGSEDALEFIKERGRTLTASIVPSEPTRPDLQSVVLDVLASSEAPLLELEIAQRIIEGEVLGADYFDRQDRQPGGRYAILRGTLLGLSRAGTIEMGRNDQGQAVFTSKDAQVTEVVNG